MEQTIKHVLVSGATGFIGSHVVRALVNADYQVSALTSQHASPARLSNILNKISLLPADPCSLSSVITALPPVHAFINVAVCYGRNNESATDLLEVNVLQPLRVIELLSNRGLQSVVLADTFYPRDRDHYALSKHQLREWLPLIAKATATPVHNLILEHVYGPSDGPSKFFPSVLKALKNNQQSLDLTRGEQTRDFVYVEDVASAFVAALSAPQATERHYHEYRIGTGKARSLRQAVELMKQLTGSSTELRFGALPYSPGEIMHSVADTRTTERLGWSATITLEDGLRHVLASLDCHDRRGT